jgi:hypothetical protein
MNILNLLWGSINLMFSNYNTMSNFKINKSNNKNNINARRKWKPKRVLNYYHQQLISYIYGLAHPELAINSSNIPKAPNYVSIPTSSITFREAFDIVPDINGEFILYWTPNFLASQAAIEQRSDHRFTNYSRNWLGTFNEEHNEFGYYPVAAYAPPASFVKYRLVSAGTRITYKGAVIERAGIISHCLTYKPMPMPFFKEDDGDYIGENMLTNAINPDEWGNSLVKLDPTVIQNGMWNNVQNVQKNQTVFVCAVPTDPSDFIFEDDGFFYQAATATTVLQPQITTGLDGNQNQYTSKYCVQLPQDGTPCSYIFRGTDLTKDAKLYVEQFYNFEVIPTEESAPILRPRKDDIPSGMKEKAKEIVTTALDKTKGVTKQITNNLIEDLLELDSDYGQNDYQISNQPQPKLVYKKPKSQSTFKQKAKNFGKFVWDNTKDVAKDIGKAVFTKENLALIGREIAKSVMAGNGK